MKIFTEDVKTKIITPREVAISRSTYLKVTILATKSLLSSIALVLKNSVPFKVKLEYLV